MIQNRENIYWENVFRENLIWEKLAAPRFLKRAFGILIP